MQGNVVMNNVRYCMGFERNKCRYKGSKQGINEVISIIYV